MKEGYVTIRVTIGVPRERPEPHLSDFIGRAGEIRTRDLLHPKQAR